MTRPAQRQLTPADGRCTSAQFFEQHQQARGRGIRFERRTGREGI